MKRRIVMILSVIVFVLSICGVFSEQRKSEEAAEKYEVLQEQVSSTAQKEEINSEELSSIVSSEEKEEIKRFEPIEQEQVPVILDKFAELYAQNNDLVGWIDNGDSINYPVMRSMEDSNFYLHKDFDKSESSAGSLYIPNDISMDDSIVIIYGHHMKDGSLFGSLKRYLEPDYFQENRTISLSTLYEEKELEVIGVFLSQVYYGDYTGFEYYNYRGNVTEQEFNEYLSGIEPLMQIGDLSDISYGDKLIELSTCNYHVKNGRLVVLCRQS